MQQGLGLSPQLRIRSEARKSVPLQPISPIRNALHPRCLPAAAALGVGSFSRPGSAARERRLGPSQHCWGGRRLHRLPAPGGQSSGRIPRSASVCAAQGAPAPGARGQLPCRSASSRKREPPLSSRTQAQPLPVPPVPSTPQSGGGCRSAGEEAHLSAAAAAAQAEGSTEEGSSDPPRRLSAGAGGTQKRGPDCRFPELLLRSSVLTAVPGNQRPNCHSPPASAPAVSASSSHSFLPPPATPPRPGAPPACRASWRHAHRARRGRLWDALVRSRTFGPARRGAARPVVARCACDRVGSPQGEQGRGVAASFCSFPRGNVFRKSGGAPTSSFLQPWSSSATADGMEWTPALKQPCSRLARILQYEPIVMGVLSSLSLGYHMGLRRYDTTEERDTCDPAFSQIKPRKAGISISVLHTRTLNFPEVVACPRDITADAPQHNSAFSSLDPPSFLPIPPTSASLVLPMEALLYHLPFVGKRQHQQAGRLRSTGHTVMDNKYIYDGAKGTTAFLITEPSRLGDYFIRQGDHSNILPQKSDGSPSSPPHLPPRPSCRALKQHNELYFAEAEQGSLSGRAASCLSALGEESPVPKFLSAFGPPKDSQYESDCL
ncbi:hypothetical protein GH733_008036, partial [Mirounga leonina]